MSPDQARSVFKATTSTSAISISPSHDRRTPINPANKTIHPTAGNVFV